MANNEHRIPNPEEIAAARRRLDEFYERVRAVPESDRVLINSDKFDGPIGLNDDGTPQALATTNEELNDRTDSTQDSNDSQ